MKKNEIRKIISMAGVAVLCAALAGCSGSEGTNTQTQTGIEETYQTENTGEE